MGEYEKMFTNDGKDKLEYIRSLVDGSANEEERTHWLSELKQSWPGVTCGGGDDPDWDKRDLVKLYEDIEFRGSLEGTRLLPGEFTPEFIEFKDLPSYRTYWIKSIFIHTSYNGQEVDTKNKVKLEAQLYWQVARPETCRLFKKFKKDTADVRKHNWSMPLLLGSQHANRFKRNTKVFVLFGEHSGRHGVVVGHEIGFDMKAWQGGKSPMLKLVMANKETGHLELRDVRQEQVKLVDLHGLLPFGLPLLNQSVEKKERQERVMERMENRIKCNPRRPKMEVVKMFWDDERDDYWDFQKDVETRKNSGN